ncbi:unnamed protein product, partial [Allacma fusca]
RVRLLEAEELTSTRIICDQRYVLPDEERDCTYDLLTSHLALLCMLKSTV